MRAAAAKRQASLRVLQGNVNRKPPFVVVHIPHSSLQIPADVANALVLSGAALERELLVMTDHFTDELFALPQDVAQTVDYPVSRLVVDPERFEADELEPMAAKGMGAVYTQTSNGQTLREAPRSDERRRLLDRFYRPHHARLTAAVEAALAAHGRCLVLDGHSFPSLALPYEDDQSPDRPDICIGTDAYHTPVWLSARAVSHLRELGVSVAVDRPFAGALVPARFFRSDPRVLALMVEVNRSLYLDEARGTKAPDFDAFARRLLASLGSIIEGVASHPPH